MFKNLAIAALVATVSASNNEFNMNEVDLAALQTGSVQILNVKKHHHHHHNKKPVGVRFVQDEENPYGKTHVERMLNETYTYEPDLKAAIARQEAQEEAFKVPSIRAINAQKDQQAAAQINPFGQAASPISGAITMTNEPDLKAAVAKQEAQEEAFAVPSVRGINGKGPGSKYVAPTTSSTL